MKEIEEGEHKEESLYLQDFFWGKHSNLKQTKKKELWFLSKPVNILLLYCLPNVSEFYSMQITDQ